MYYCDGMHKIPIKKIRKIDATNFNPMCYHLLDSHLTGCIQALVDGIGGLRWINVNLRDIYIS